MKLLSPQNKHTRFRIGLRTIKTALAIVLAMLVVDTYGATSSKLIFAMLGALAAVQPTFKESWSSCLTQIVGVLFGALIGIGLMYVPISHLAATGIGIILVITLYNALRIRFSPSLPCFIVVLICTTPDIEPVTYALGRIWDTAIGLGIGMVINTLVFPYDNRRRIRATMESLDREVIRFLEDMFDGDDILPNAGQTIGKARDIESQLKIFANQPLIMLPKHYRQQLATYRSYDEKAKQLIVHMEVLGRMGYPGRLDEENRQRLLGNGAVIRDTRPMDSVTERDIITNYHVRKILSLRRELLDALKQRI